LERHGGGVRRGSEKHSVPKKIGSARLRERALPQKPAWATDAVKRKERQPRPSPERLWAVAHSPPTYSSALVFVSVSSTSVRSLIVE
jgi:hypothetical protein